VWPSRWIPFGDVAFDLYGLCCLLGWTAALVAGAILSDRLRLPAEKVVRLGVFTVCAALAGAKVFDVLVHVDRFRASPGNVLSIDRLRSSGVWYGGFAVAVLVGVVLARRWQLPKRMTADVAGPCVALGHAIGRIGCLSSGCCWGRPTHLPIGITFPQAAHDLTGVPAGIALFPTQPIESLFNLALFASLTWWLLRRPRPGTVFATYLVAYSVFRFFIEFVRGDPRSDWDGLSPSQGVAIATCAAGVVLFARLVRFDQRARRTLLPEA
jgi:phosphatidylglycerol:prolipoprotein diacylglycerol transferase